MKPTNRFHSANNDRWEAASEGWERAADSRGLWRRCPSEPKLVFSDTELQYLTGIAGKRVCVLGSGDNQVVFALSGMGALVTSVDISQNQLKNKHLVDMPKGGIDSATPSNLFLTKEFLLTG